MGNDHTWPPQRGLQELLVEELSERGETSDDLSCIIIGSNRDDYESHETRTVMFAELEAVERDDWGSLPGLRAWSELFVYFSHGYDGWQTVESVHRHPSKAETHDIDS